MINQETGQELWLYIETFIVVDGVPFDEGVTWDDYSVNQDGSYTVRTTISGEVKDYIIPEENALETTRFIRSSNIPTHEWMYRQRTSDVRDYIKATKEYLGITITSEPTFRDGESPHKDNGESTD